MKQKKEDDIVRLFVLQVVVLRWRSDLGSQESGLTTWIDTTHWRKNPFVHPSMHPLIRPRCRGLPLDRYALDKYSTFQLNLFQTERTEFHLSSLKLHR